MAQGKWEDLTGQTFGNLTIIGLSSAKKDYACSVWKCRCKCGSITHVDTNSLTSGNTKSCGCLRSKPKNDMAGQRFGMLEVVGYAGKGKWYCKCACGNLTDVYRSNLVSGNTTSCGCLSGKPRSVVGIPPSAQDSG